jgi:hypothetical protein
MVLKDPLSWKRCVTNWTAVRFFSSVLSHMFLKIAFSWKWFVTKWTAERFLSSMQSQMGLKIAFCCKGFVTKWTSIRFLSIVLSHMFLKVAFLWKRFVTNWTSVRFLTSVQLYMVLKVIFSWKWFVTQWTAKGFLPSVHFHVNLKFAQRRERFCTLKAVKGFLPSVPFHMSLMVPWAWEHLGEIGLTFSSHCIFFIPESNNFTWSWNVSKLICAVKFFYLLCRSKQVNFSTEPGILPWHPHVLRKSLCYSGTLIFLSYFKGHHKISKKLFNAEGHWKGSYIEKIEFCIIKTIWSR